MIEFLIIVGTVTCMDMSGYKRVDSEYSYLVPMDFDFNKKNFHRDGPAAPFDKAIIYDTWDDENEYYQCTTPSFSSENVSYCKSWLLDLPSYVATTNNSLQEKCRCLETSMGPNYCTYWFCTQLVPEVTGESATRSNQHERTLNEDTEYERTINEDIDYTDCVCRYESMNGKYCQQWWCLKTPKYGNTEVEEYNCDRASNGSDFCFKWSGRLSAPQRREWSTCECNSQLMRQYHCDKWTCYVKGRSYVWNFIFLLIISGFSFVLLQSACCYTCVGLCVEQPKRCEGPLGFILIVVFGCLVGGGCIQAGGLIGLLIGGVWTLIALVLWFLSNKKCNNNQNITSNWQSNIQSTLIDLVLWFLQFKKYNNNQNNTSNQQSNNQSTFISSNQNEENNGVPVGYPAPKQEIQMYSTSGPISGRSGRTYYQII